MNFRTWFLFDVKISLIEVIWTAAICCCHQLSIQSCLLNMVLSPSTELARFTSMRIYLENILRSHALADVNHSCMQCWKRHNLQSSRWFEIRVFLLFHVPSRLRIMRNPSHYWRNILPVKTSPEPPGSCWGIAPTITKMPDAVQYTQDHVV